MGDEVLHTTGTPQLLCHECAAIDLGSFRPAAAANALARTNQAERLVTAALDLQDERLTKTACAEDGTRLTCSVCLDSMRAGQSVVRLPCAHTFHSACLKAWFCKQNAHNRCPLCRHVASDAYH